MVSKLAEWNKSSDTWEVSIFFPLTSEIHLDHIVKTDLLALRLRISLPEDQFLISNPLSKRGPDGTYSHDRSHRKSLGPPKTCLLHYMTHEEAIGPTM